MEKILFTAGILIGLFGGAVSAIFWMPRIINRDKLREMLGSRYPMVYLLYIANGPLMLLFGLLLVYRFH